MKNKFEKKLVDEITSKVPDCKDAIKSKINWDTVKANNARAEQTKKETKKRSRFIPKFVTSMSIAVMLVLCIALPIMLHKPSEGGGKVPGQTENFYVTMSINPKVELKVDGADNVVSQKGLNEDGIKLLLHENLVGKNVNTAADKIVELANTYGYITKDKQIKIAVFGEDKKEKTDEYDKIQNSINGYLSTNNILSGGANKLSATELEEVYNYYNNFNGGEYEEQAHLDFTAKIKSVIESKIVDAQVVVDLMNKVIDPLDVQEPALATLLGDDKADDSDSDSGEGKDIIIDSGTFKTQLLDFSNTYNFKKNDIDFDKMTLADAKEICDELKDIIKDMNEILTELNGGADEEDFKDRIKDIMEIAKELLFAEEDD